MKTRLTRTTVTLHHIQQQHTTPINKTYNTPITITATAMQRYIYTKEHMDSHRVSLKACLQQHVISLTSTFSNEGKQKTDQQKANTYIIIANQQNKTLPACLLTPKNDRIGHLTSKSRPLETTKQRQKVGLA